MDAEQRAAWEAALCKRGKRRAKIRGELRDLSTEIADLAAEGYKAGIPKIEICRLAHITRPALDKMLADREL